MAYRASIFDLDGTLVDSLEDIADATNAVLQRLGLPTHPVDAYRAFVGEGVEVLVRRAAPEATRTDEDLARLAAKVRAEYAAHYADKTRPYPGVPEALQELGRRGLRLAVLSNKPHDGTLRVVEALLGQIAFEAVLGARDGVPKKPDPSGALEIASQLGLPPTQFLYVGDTNIDMATARAAGMHAVGVTWGFRTAGELWEAGAHAVIGRPEELVEIFQRGDEKSEREG